MNRISPKTCGNICVVTTCRVLFNFARSPDGPNTLWYCIFSVSWNSLVNLWLVFGNRSNAILLWSVSVVKEVTEKDNKTRESSPKVSEFYKVKNNLHLKSFYLGLLFRLPSNLYLLLLFWFNLTCHIGALVLLLRLGMVEAWRAWVTKRDSNTSLDWQFIVTGFGKGG